jgi:restriction system protein
LLWISVRSTHHQSPRGRDITENGRQVTEADIKPLHAEFVAESAKKSKATKTATKPDIEGQIDQIEAEADCKDKPLETPLAMSPQAFER